MYTEDGVGRGPAQGQRRHWRATSVAALAVLVGVLMAPTAMAPPHARAAVVTAAVARCRRLFDLDADPIAVDDERFDRVVGVRCRRGDRRP